jgi:hypothetical protein
MAAVSPLPILPVNLAIFRLVCFHAALDMLGGPAGVMVPAAHTVLRLEEEVAHLGGAGSGR